MKTINKLYLLIHGFCYAEIELQNKKTNPKHTLYMERENRCAKLWASRIHEFSDNDALIIIPFSQHPDGPSSQFKDLAVSVLGDRCFFLDRPGYSEQSFWDKASIDFEKAVTKELSAVCIGLKKQWNEEDLSTTLHTLACFRQFEDLLVERNFQIDVEKTFIEAWGASFEGCVTKYSLNFRRFMLINNPIEIDFALTVPDAPFLLNFNEAESILLKDGLRVFIFKDDSQTIALYTTTSNSLDCGVTYVKLKVDPTDVRIRSKQNTRIWPELEPYHLEQASITNYEPPQQLVKVEDGCVYLPASAGLAYSLAKSPLFVFSTPGSSYEKNRDMFIQAEIYNNH